MKMLHISDTDCYASSKKRNPYGLALSDLTLPLLEAASA